MFRHANDNMGMKDREIKSLHRQFDSTSEDLSETSRSKDIALRENRRLQDDLAVMTRENQVYIHNKENMILFDYLLLDMGSVVLEYVF